MSSVILPENAVISLAGAVNGYIPGTPASCTEKVLLMEDGQPLLKTVAYDRTGMFIRGLMVDYMYFCQHKRYRLGYIMDSIMSLFKPKKRVRITSKYLLILWTDQLTEVDSLYPTIKGDLQILQSKREALDQYHRLSKLLIWLKTQKEYHLKNVDSKEVRQILSEYVTGAGITFTTLQSAFQQVVKKSLLKKSPS